MGLELNYLTIAEASKLIAHRDLSPVELADAFLARIAAVDSRLHSFIRVTPERALAEARAAESDLAQGRRRGPLQGIPYAVKDVYETAGIPTTGGSQAFADHVPAADSTCVLRLKEAGAVLLGKLATHELTYGGVSFDLPWPPARNPWNPEHDPGGSSTGAGAAVAVGLAMGALGTDTGGSIRVPAALSGIVGLKPTYGRVSRAGVIQNSYTLDACGPLAWTVEDATILFEAIAGHDPKDPAAAAVPAPEIRAHLGAGIKGLRVGVVRHFHEADLPCHPEARAAFEKALSALSGLGAVIEEVRLSPLRTYADCKVTIQLPEIHALYQKDLEERPAAFGWKFRRRIAPGAKVPAVDYVRAQETRRRLTAEMAAALGRVDALITLGAPGPAPRLDEVAAEAQLNKPEITVPFSLVGFPAVAVCSGFSSCGLPLAIQIAGRPFDEATILKIAYAYEHATPWRARRPNLG